MRAKLKNINAEIISENIRIPLIAASFGANFCSEYPEKILTPLAIIAESMLYTLWDCSR